MPAINIDLSTVAHNEDFHCYLYWHKQYKYKYRCFFNKKLYFCNNNNNKTL